MALIKKSIGSRDVIKCDGCGEELTAFDLIDIVAEGLKETDESVVELSQVVERVADEALETDMLMYETIKDLRTKIGLLVDNMGMEFVVEPEVPAIPAKTVLKKKSKKK